MRKNYPRIAFILISFEERTGRTAPFRGKRLKFPEKVPKTLDSEPSEDYNLKACKCETVFVCKKGAGLEPVTPTLIIYF